MYLFFRKKNLGGDREKEREREKKSDCEQKLTENVIKQFEIILKRKIVKEKFSSKKNRNCKCKKIIIEKFNKIVINLLKT